MAKLDTGTTKARLDKLENTHEGIKSVVDWAAAKAFGVLVAIGTAIWT
jgi:hypothetical protein